MAAQCRLRISPSISELFEQACLPLCRSSFRIAGKILNFWTNLCLSKKWHGSFIMEKSERLRSGSWGGGIMLWEEEWVGKEACDSELGQIDEVSIQAQDVCWTWVSRARLLYLELHLLLQDVGSDSVVIVTPPHTPPLPDTCQMCWIPASLSCCDQWTCHMAEPTLGGCSRSDSYGCRSLIFQLIF